MFGQTYWTDILLHFHFFVIQDHEVNISYAKNTSILLPSTLRYLQQSIAIFRQIQDSLIVIVNTNSTSRWI